MRLRIKVEIVPRALVMVWPPAEQLADAFVEAGLETVVDDRDERPVSSLLTLILSVCRGRLL